MTRNIDERETPASPAGHVIDVNRLVRELRQRVQDQRALGGDADDLAAVELEPPGRTMTVRFRPELAYSTRTGVGRGLTLLKRGILRLLIHVFDDLARQTDAAIGAVRTETLQAAGAIRDTRSWAEAALDAEAAAREEAQAAVSGLMHRIEAVEDQLDRLQLAPRLARLERTTRRPVERSTADEAPADSPGAAPYTAQPIDYLAFEARFRGSEETVRARQAIYLEVLRDRRRVVDLGCGRGELIDLLDEAGVSAYGVEVNDDFVDLLREKGLEVVRQDLIEHLAALDPGAVDAIVASHVVEHLPPAAISRMIVSAGEVLSEGGILIIETPNPESLVAGSVNFHRDPTHVRPVHPDTLAFLCESAGFSEATIRRLSPVPDSEQLPSPAPGEDALSGHVGRVVERLNALLYGFQDYAVIARR
jgi:SAM-dependent methyltransferase